VVIAVAGVAVVIGVAIVTVSRGAAMIGLFENQTLQLVVARVPDAVRVERRERRRPVTMWSESRMRVVDHLSGVQMNVVRRAQTGAEHGKRRRDREQRLAREPPGTGHGRRVQLVVIVDTAPFTDHYGAGRADGR
jgi:hypothetical protein